MNHPLHLSKEDHDAIIQRVAELLFERITFDPEELMVVSTATVSQVTGLSTKQVQRKFPITVISTQKQGVQLSTLKKYIKDNTKPPSA